MSDSVALRAGPWSLLYRAGDLWDLRVDGVTVMSRIYAAVRDHAWGTVPGTIADLAIERGPRSFRITYRSEHRADGIAFANSVTLEGAADGRIVMRMRGVARCPFLRRRIGLCVHHDQGLAGAWVRVEHGDGRREDARFPVAIAPDQPFYEVAALTVRTHPQRTATVRFAGDVFETEDQRNWGDASFKTYGTPLARPAPVAVAAGEVVEQEVEVTLAGHGIDLAAEYAPAVDPAALAAAGVTRLRATVTNADDLVLLRGAPLPLDLVLHGSPESWQVCAGLRLASVVAVPTDRRTTPTAWVDRLREHLPGIPVGGGTIAQFTELNRDRPVGGGWTVLDVPVDPYMHAGDERSLLGNVPAISAIARSAQALMPGAAVHLALAHGRHPEHAARHRGSIGRVWLERVIDTAAAAGVTLLSLGPATWLPTTD